MIYSQFHRMLPVLWLLILAFQPGLVLHAQTATPPAPTYEALLARGNSLMQSGDLHGAANTAAEAIQLDKQRYEAFVLAALIRFQQTNQVQAQRFLARAYALAPADRKAALDRVAAIINAPTTAPPAAPATAQPSPTAAPTAAENHEMVHQREILKLILADADANTGAARQPFLSEFLTKSAAYVATYPNDASIWMLRAVTAAELNDYQAGWEAGQKLKALGMADSDNPAIIKVMAVLDRKGWLHGGNPLTEFDGTWEGTVEYNSSRKCLLAGTDRYHQVQQWRITMDQKSKQLSILLLDYDKSLDDVAAKADVLVAMPYLANACIEPKGAPGHGYTYHDVSYAGHTATWNINCGQGDSAFGRARYVIDAQLKISADGNSAEFFMLAVFENDRELMFKGSGTLQRVPNPSPVTAALQDVY